MRHSYIALRVSETKIISPYEACSEIIETIAILSKGRSIIHQVLYIWGLVLNYLIAAFNGYDPVAFLRLIPPLHQSVQNVGGGHCTVSLIYYRLNEPATINSFASKVYLCQ